ncbi:oxidoreductase family protein [Rhizoctonia solani]|uniref:Oxidoreductase family protein n=1 Tax=Rhizoctonia solani TaxID=456999 RepID=A0A8H8NQ69_9AGAM|nr:oxidoreductase family protein [Rhizoctonia solani]QRW16762.1 oxidoreductase family protein [Rhizoctonia solani]
MATESYKLGLQAIFVLAVLECLLQGVLIPMSLTSFKASSANEKPLWFKVYVLGINGLGLTQTILVIAQGFYTIDGTPGPDMPMHTCTLLTPIIAALVQLFFIYRCWVIFNKQLLPAVILLSLLIISFTSGFVAVLSYPGWIPSIPFEKRWIPTIVFLHNTREGASESIIQQRD